MRRINLYITAVLVVLLVIYLALLDTLAKPIFESQATEMYGAEVTIDSMQISPFVGKVTLHQLQVADRRNAMRNLAEAERAYLDIGIIKLAQNIVEVDDLEIDGLVFLTHRDEPAEILRPLLPENSDIATAGLPSFELPDVDTLVERQRDKLDADIAELKSGFASKEAKWQEKIDGLPGEDEIKAYKQRVKKLKDAKGLDRLKAVAELQKIYAEVNNDLENLSSMQQEFRGDIQSMRERIDAAVKLPEKHTNQLIDSLGLSSGQMAQLGSRLLRGDLSGLTQQVLAPLAYNASGEVSAEDSMPIFIREADINGPILASAAGFSAAGKLQNFAWPLELAELPAVLNLEGSSLDGGSMNISASVDHRSSPDDSVSVNISNLTLRDMVMRGTDDLKVTLNQTLANIEGSMRVDGEQLSGQFTQNFSKTLFDTQLSDNAGGSAKLIAAMLQNSTDFMLQIGFSGTLQSPDISFKADMDELIANTLQQAISERVGQLTQQLQNEISDEIGPEVTAARERFASLEAVQKQLQDSLANLKAVR